MLKIRSFLFLRAEAFSDLLKATVKKLVTIPGYTRRDGTFVPPHQKSVHYNPDALFSHVASGQGSHSQKKAHAKLSAKDWWQNLSTDDKAIAVMSAATDIQDAASSSAAVSGWKKQALEGVNPKAAQWAAFHALPDQKKGALYDEVKAKVGGVAHLAAASDTMPVAAVAPVAAPAVAATEQPAAAPAVEIPAFTSSAMVMDWAKARAKKLGMSWGPYSASAEYKDVVYPMAQKLYLSELNHETDAGPSAGIAASEVNPSAAATPIPVSEAQASMSEDEAIAKLQDMMGGSHYQQVAVSKLEKDAQWKSAPPHQQLEQAVALYKGLQGAASHSAAVSMAKKAMLAGKVPSKAQHAALLSASSDALSKVMQAVGIGAFQKLMGQAAAAAGGTASAGVKPATTKSPAPQQAATPVAPVASFDGANGITVAVYKNPKGFVVMVKDTDSGESLGSGVIYPTQEWAESAAENVADGKPAPMEGATKPGSNGTTLTLKNGHWVSLQKDALTPGAKKAIDSLSPAELQAVVGASGLPPATADYVASKIAAAQAAPAPAVKAKPPEPVNAYVLSNTTPGHNKMWAISQKGSEVTASWGKIGGPKQMSKKDFSSPELAAAYIASKIEEKKKGGYEESVQHVEHTYGGEPGKQAAAPAAAPAPAPAAAPAPSSTPLTKKQKDTLKIDAQKVNAWFDPATDGKTSKDTTFFDYVLSAAKNKFFNLSNASKSSYYGQTIKDRFKSQAVSTLFGKPNVALTTRGVFVSSTDEVVPGTEFVTDAVAIKAAVVASWASDPVAGKAPASASAAGAFDPLPQWTSFTNKHWGTVAEMSDIKPFLQTKDAGAAALQAFTSGAFIDINMNPSSPEAKAMAGLVDQLPVTDLKTIHRALGFDSKDAVDSFIDSLFVGEAPNKQKRSFTSWTAQDPGLPGQTPMNNIALDLASINGDHLVLLKLQGSSSAKDISFAYAKDGKSKPGGELLLSAGAMLDVVSKKTDGNTTSLLVKEVHEGDTKQGVGGLLVLKDGHWVLANPGESKATTTAPDGKEAAPAMPWKDQKLAIIKSIPKPHMGDFKNEALISQALENLLSEVEAKGVVALSGITKNMKKTGKLIVNLPHPTQSGVIKITGLHASPNSSHTQLYNYLVNLKAALQKPFEVPESVKEAKAVKAAAKLEATLEAKASAKVAAGVTGAPIIPTSHSSSMEGWKQIGEQKGSNPGGKFIDKDGQEWYVKFPATESHVKNELLAGKFYEMLGVAGPKLTQVRQGDKVGIASRWVDGTQKVTPEALKGLPGAVENFPIDVWLANWDAVGTGYDNMLKGPDGKALRIDAGGALLYRAQGQAKGSDFSSDVPELSSMMDASKNSFAAAVFGGANPSSFAVALHKMALLKPSQIDEMVETYGPTDKALRLELSTKLKARRDVILKKYGVADPHNKAPVDESKIKVNPADLSMPLDFSNIDGKPLSSKPHVNEQNSKDSKVLVEFASHGNLKALKDYHYAAVDKESGAPLGKKPIVEHPSNHIKKQWGELVQTLQSIAHPFVESLSLPASGGILDAFFHPSDNVSTITSEFSMGFFMKLGESLTPPPMGVAPFYLKAQHETVSKASAIYGGYSALTKKFIQAVQASGWVNHVWSQGKKGVVSQMDVPIQKLASEVFQNSTEMLEGAILTRNMHDSSGETVKALLAAKPGVVFQNTDSMCSSFKEDWSSFGSDITMKIVCAKGSRALVSWGSGSMGGEQEITTLPGARFYIKSITKGAHNGTSSKGVTVECVMLPPVDGYLASLENEVGLGKSFNTGPACKPHTKTIFLLRSPRPSVRRLLVMRTSSLPCFPNFAKRATH